MFSYVYMKILESRPRRYDRGIAWLSLGASERAKDQLINELVAPGMRVLEVGCGTGTLAVLAAQKGARVLGFDVSGPMLQVAREKVQQAGLGDLVELKEMGIAGMDGLERGGFDLVLATLVLSELSEDEQRYTLEEAHRVLAPGGRLAIADEARPRTPGGRLVHAAVRAPLALVTYVMTQTTTRAVERLAERVARAGFTIEHERRSALDSFVYLIAVRE